MGSYLSNFAEGNIGLSMIVEIGSLQTLNVYVAIACNPQTLTHTNFDASMAFIKFLISDDVQDLLQDFGVSEYGDALFKPWIPMLKGGQDPDLIQWVEDYAYFEGGECPTQYRYNAGDIYD
jgi:ABC-type tungstate transport system permease subunit